MTDWSAPPARAPTRRPHVWSRFRNHRGAELGALVFALIILAVTLGPVIWPHAAGELDVLSRNQGPSWGHPAGTDQLGRDMLAALLAGGRISILVGLVAMGLSILLGTLIGIVAGTVRWLDAPLMRFTDLMLSLPLLPLLLVTLMLWRDPARTAFGAQSGIFLLIVVVIGLTSWMQTARIVRGEVLALREPEFIMAATAVGVGPLRMIRRHFLPGVVGPIMVSATLGFANALLTESALSFLGLGFPPDIPTWGRLLFDGSNYMTLTPARVIMPGLAISLTVLSVNYIGDGLRDALDPRWSGKKVRGRS